MENVVPIIEWQDEKQRTPQEVVRHLVKEVEDWNPERMLVLLWKDDQVQYVPASKNRDFMNKDIFWDVTGWLDIWRKDVDREQDKQ